MKALALFLVLMMPAPLLACLWDNDTLRDEIRGLPGIAEVLAGKYERHSRYFYERRVIDMTLLLEKDPNNLAAYDNLAVAYEKLDNQDKAIEVILQKEKIKPGEYTTYANLGTFYLHKGDLNTGIAYIEKALQINPQAHFGREEYQLKAAKFMRDKRDNPAFKPTMSFLFYEDKKPTIESGRYDTLMRVAGRGRSRWNETGLNQDVFDGLVGMLRFGSGRSAELYFALGEVLALRGEQHLAYRSFQRAVDLDHPLRDQIQELMKQVRGRVEDERDFDADDIAKERAEGEAWLAAYQKFEDDMLRANKSLNDEAAYAPFYKEYGQAKMNMPFDPNDLLPRRPEARKALLIGVLCAIGFASYVAFKRRRARLGQPV